MKFMTIIVTLVASSPFITAAPTEKSTAVKARGCPNNYDFCGECNGTSCKVAGINYKCSIGSCTSQSGAGDGAICGTTGTLAQGPYECPGGR
ncbi:hypothetical protein V492_00175 [Pseudogymnoascus sp. VKM F-4246]|nr:hypothetical protein V492_00175 [Pseudogymnoascus sp. VKM F-4246]KFY29874.1 hypothetical protein V494_08413 [Pseudogymnoascus sp. VKM F-4513 (FW-928)]